MNDVTISEVKFDAEAHVVSTVAQRLSLAMQNLELSNGVSSPSRRLYEEMQMALWQKIWDALPGMLADPMILAAIPPHPACMLQNEIHGPHPVDDPGDNVCMGVRDPEIGRTPQRH